MGKSVKEVETVIERVESDAKSTKARAYIREQRDAELRTMQAEGDFDAVLNRAIQTSATQLKSLGPSGRLGWLRKALTELGLSTESLTAAQKAADVAVDMRRRAHERQMEAGRRRQDAFAKLAGNPGGSLDAAVAAWAAEAPWLDVAAGHDQPPALGAAARCKSSG